VSLLVDMRPQASQDCELASATETLAELTLGAVMAASAKALTATAARAGTAGLTRLWLLLPAARQQADGGQTRPEMGR
jgi:hypothetical protein